MAEPRAAQDLRGGVRMGLVQGCPLLAYLVLHRKVHIAPAVMHPELQWLPLELDGPVIPAGELEHVGDPVDHAEGALKVELDHVPFRLVVDLVIDLMGHPQQLPDLGGVIFDGDVLHRIGDPSGVGVILAGIDEILLIGKPPIPHVRAAPLTTCLFLLVPLLPIQPLGCFDDTFYIDTGGLSNRTRYGKLYIIKR